MKNHELSIADRVADCLAALDSAARAANFPLSGDGRVSEAHAAALLGIAAGTLRNYRSSAMPIPWHRIGGIGGRVTYRLRDLAEHIEMGRAND